MLNIGLPTSDEKLRRRLPEVMSRNRGIPQMPGFMRGGLMQDNAETQAASPDYGNSFLGTFMKLARSTVPWATQQLADRRKKMMDAETEGLVDRQESLSDAIRRNSGIRSGMPQVTRTPGDVITSPFAPSRTIALQRMSQPNRWGMPSGQTTHSPGSFAGGQRADTPQPSPFPDYGTYEGGRYKPPLNPMGTPFVPYSPQVGTKLVDTGQGTTSLISSSTPNLQAPVTSEQAIESAPVNTDALDMATDYEWQINPETGMMEKVAKKKATQEDEDSGGV
jgi:hypothetical protein